MHSRASNNDEQQPLTSRTSDAPQASSVASAVDEAPSERSASRAHRPRARPPSLARPFTPQRKCAGSPVFTLQRSGPRLNFAQKSPQSTCGERGLACQRRVSNWPGRESQQMFTYDRSQQSVSGSENSVLLGNCIAKNEKCVAKTPRRERHRTTTNRGRGTRSHSPHMIMIMSELMIDKSTIV